MSEHFDRYLSLVDVDLGRISFNTIPQFHTYALLTGHHGEGVDRELDEVTGVLHGPVEHGEAGVGFFEVKKFIQEPNSGSTRSL